MVYVQSEGQAGLHSVACHTDLTVDLARVSMPGLSWLHPLMGVNSFIFQTNGME